MPKLKKSPDLRGVQLTNWAKMIFHSLFLIVPTVFFLTFFHIEILDPTNISWLMAGDWGGAALGWHAFRYDDWRWPITRTDLLFWPAGASITYADSNPLVAIPLKGLSFLLPENFQFIGPWFLLCLILQFCFGYLLLRSHAQTKWLALIGATVFLLLPSLYFRMGHATLMAHWVILWTLYVYFEEPTGLRRIIQYAAVLSTAALLHPYLLIMVAAIWGADQLRFGFQLISGDITKTAVAKYVVSVIAPLGVCVGVLFTLGYFADMGQRGCGFDDACSFGKYSMNLNALVNPMNENFSAFLNERPQGVYQYEGFQYLGLGLIFLILSAVILAIANPPKGRFARSSGQFFWLLPALVPLSLLSISNIVRLDDHIVLSIPLGDQTIERILGIVRASGSFFWPVVYVGLFATLRLLYRQKPRMVFVILGAAFIIQILDMRTFIAEMKGRTAAATHSEFGLIRDPRWADIIAHSRGVKFEPPHGVENSPMFIQLSWKSVAQKKPVNTMYLARYSPRHLDAHRQVSQEFRSGDFDPEYLYVLWDGCRSVPHEHRDKIREIDGVLFVPPQSALNDLGERPENC